MLKKFVLMIERLCGPTLGRILLVGVLASFGSYPSLTIAQQEVDLQKERKTGYTLVPGRSSQRLRILLNETNTALSELSETLGNDAGLKTHQESVALIAAQISDFIRATSETPEIRLEGLKKELLKALGEIKVSIDKIQAKPPGTACIDEPCDLRPYLNRIVESIKALKIEVVISENSTEKTNSEQSHITELAQAIVILRNQISATAIERDPEIQIPIDKKLAAFYPGAEIEYMFVSLPDPRVPRHRRGFENSLNSITSGLSEQMYTLDRYYFPWQNYLTKPGGEVSKCHFEEPDSASWAGKNCFGILIYRMDEWRNFQKDEQTGVKLLVLYVIPEAVTYGVMKGAIFGAFEHLKMLGNNLTPYNIFAIPEIYPYCGNDQNRVVVAGPAFSGSIYSLTETFRIAINYYHKKAHKSPRPKSLCVVSWSATSSSNANISDWRSVLARIPVVYQSLVSTDDKKIDKIKDIAAYLGVEKENIFFFLERSTFGQTICSTNTNVNEKGSQIDLCLKDVKIPGTEQKPGGEKSKEEKEENRQIDTSRVMTFSANIAEIRAYLGNRGDDDSELPFGIGKSQLKGIKLDDVSENGSEYPTSHQSILTVVGMDLELKMQLENLRAQKPEIIVVAATEVRDRLFLIRHFRTSIPDALIIDFESDILLSHPAFLDATRGMLQLGSVGIVSDPTLERSVSQSEHQVLLKNLFAGNGVVTPGNVVVSVIGRKGPVDITELYGLTTTWQNFFRGKTLLLLMLVGLFHLLWYLGLQPNVRKFAKRYNWVVTVLRSISQIIEDISAKVKSFTSRNSKLTKGFRVITLAIPAVFAILLVVVIATSLKLIVYKDLLVNEFDIGLLVILGALLVGAWRLSHIRCLSRKKSWHAKLRSIPEQYIGVCRDRFGITSSVGVALGGIAVLLLITDVVSPIIFDFKLQWDHIISILKLGILPAPGFSSASGLTWGLPFLGTVTATAYAAMMLSSITVCSRKNESIWKRLVEKLLDVELEVSKWKSSNVTRGIHIGFLLAFWFAFSRAMPLGISALGGLSDICFFLALCGSSFTAWGALCLASFHYEQFDYRISILRRRATKTDNEDKIVGFFIKDWSLLKSQDEEKFSVTPILAENEDNTVDYFIKDWSHFKSRDEEKFSITPIVARPAWNHAQFADNQAVSERIWPAGIVRETGEMRSTLRELITRDIWCMRRLVQLSLLGCLASVLLVYCYPVPGRDGFLTLNMIIMVVTAILFAIVTIRLERNEIVSRIISDRKQTIRWSFGLIYAMAMPFVLISIAIMVSEVPGVRELAGDWLSPLMKILGFRWF